MRLCEVCNELVGEGHSHENEKPWVIPKTPAKVSDLAVAFGGEDDEDDDDPFIIRPAPIEKPGP